MRTAILCTECGQVAMENIHEISVMYQCATRQCTTDLAFSLNIRNSGILSFSTWALKREGGEGEQ